jgi:Prokaryotic membrane lipoprotein lipid attachment site
MRRVLAAVLLVFALAGCNTHTTHNPGPLPSPSASHCVIPQHNGGDHDADNNGGPSEGDGCDK